MVCNYDVTNVEQVTLRALTPTEGFVYKSKLISVKVL